MQAFNKKLTALVLVIFIAACGGGGEADVPAVAMPLAETHAETSNLSVHGQSSGVTPFIKTLTLGLDNYATLESITFRIAPKDNTHSKPVTVTYPRAYLDREGYYNDASKQIALPVFALYPGHANNVTLTARFVDGSSRDDAVTVETAPYDDPTKVYSALSVKTARTAGSTLNFDYIMIQSGVTTPVVIDTDGNLRWVGSGIASGFISMLINDGFAVGSPSTPELHRLKWDGTFTTARLSNPNYTGFHHDLTPGKVGLLAEVDATVDGVKRVESILAEIDENGTVLKEWDMAAIFTDVMQKGGDDPANFVRNGFDWFHMNSAIYVPEDDSLIVSSRENFVVKIDYATGAIKWLLGDTTKHWYVNFPSLRPYTLMLTNGTPPIGQHALSIASDGTLLLFNNGFASTQNPAGTPAGRNLTFSAASKYAIDEASKTATQVWTFENGQAVYSDVCSSVYESAPDNYLVNYAVAANRTIARLLGLDAAGNIAFDFEMPTDVCNTSWNSQPVALQNLVFQ